MLCVDSGSRTYIDSQELGFQGQLEIRSVAETSVFSGASRYLAKGEGGRNKSEE